MENLYRDLKLSKLKLFGKLATYLFAGFKENGKIILVLL